ncbi:ThiF family adenylyltransferase [Virgibacillus pantothenticus]|uniref:ThiF family adenylyltransferase n=1 Tax=Virgibacillus pantothenticus TaxID=1473 RepID=UPI001C2408C8|nr:ThiF family adenylyltransferase [Virgibacillus pantothenticus]MBU8566171.1 ThiF family adenylyltransferase [Virgibacillus pantothenticus]MBU8600533.1 ThiF family adenylyltransferase [Virgibacillus pantothenticus]MBU8634491.1 ThiF family adenylyltransferase [Virgibacillus pantothenticus]MBU8642672.1 ThiF family adenylyltransferase [Virgibacillus pantothenticus]MBU8647086.1 ThiF family adenylyltransferase [Virgibacillus pantothenticus]
MEERYSRQMLFQPIGEKGQAKLAASHVVMIGCGALGTNIAETLIRAGVGKLTIADRDYVEMSNLQRQQMFTEQDAREGTPKVIAVKRVLQEVREDANIQIVLDHVDGPLLEQLVSDADLIMDATDNFETRLLINDVAWKRGLPWIYGACVGSTGVVFPFVPQQTACFRCLLPALPAVTQTCDTAGIIAPAASMVAANQSTEALKWLTGNSKKLRSKLFHFDIWNNSFMEVGISRMKKEACPTCSHQATYPALEKQEETNFAVLCGRDTVQVIPIAKRQLAISDGEQVVKRLGVKHRITDFFIEFYIQSYRCILFQNGRMFIHGLKDISQGRKLYHQLFG